MYINAIYDADLQNGEGVGVTVCVSGCPIKCQGCFNKEAQNPVFGKEYGIKEIKKISSLLSKPYIDHLAIIGGEPLTKDKIYDIAHLCFITKLNWPQKKIWLWSGYRWEDIYALAFWDNFCSLGTQEKWGRQDKDSLRRLLENIDILVDGPFIQEQKDITLKWRGSKNQRVISVQATLNRRLGIYPVLYCN